MESTTPFPHLQDVVPEAEKDDRSSEGGDIAIAAVNKGDQDREYGCKYCQKKFSNKQALGGHQNAHKLERAMEKNVGEVQENHFGFLGGGFRCPGMTPSGPVFLGSYNKSYQHLSRAMYRPYPPHQAPLQHEIPFVYNPHTSLPLSSEPSRTSMVALVGRMALFPEQASRDIPNQCFNRQVLAVGSRSMGGRANEFAPVHQIEDSGLDLSLKL